MKKIVFIGFTTLLIIISLSGCLNQETNQKNMEKLIFGEWYNEQTFFNQETNNTITYTVVYEFFSNMSFFSGIWNSSAGAYTAVIRGTYELNNGKIYFMGEDRNSDVSVHEYHISADGNTLYLYYEDGSGYDVFKRYV